MKAGTTPGPILTALHTITLDQVDRVMMSLRVIKLGRGMLLYEDVLSSDGAILAKAGTELTSSLVHRLRNFASGAGVVEPVVVLSQVA